MENKTKASPKKFILKSSPFKFIRIIPEKPKIQANIFLNVSFSCLKTILATKIAKKALENNVDMIITADHGNAEWMFNEQTQAPQTAHTTNVVPFIVVSNDKYELNTNGALCDIAPSILDILEIEKRDTDFTVSL